MLRLGRREQSVRIKPWNQPATVCGDQVKVKSEVEARKEMGTSFKNMEGPGKVGRLGKRRDKDERKAGR